jgi:hypothetical protein
MPKKEVKGAVTFITVPYIAADKAMNYPLQETDSTLIVKSTTTLKGITVDTFSNQQAAAFKAAYAKATGVEAANVEVKLAAKQPGGQDIAVEVVVKGVQGKSAASKIQSSSKNAVGSSSFTQDFNQEMVNFGGIQNDVATQNSEMTTFYAQNPTVLPAGVTAATATATVSAQAAQQNSVIAASAVSPMKEGSAVVTNIESQSMPTTDGTPGRTVDVNASDGLGGGAIAGIVIGLIATLALVVIAVVLVKGKTDSRQAVITQSTHATTNPVGMDGMVKNPSLSLPPGEGPEEL